MISSDVAPARLLATTAQVTGRMSVTMKDLSPAALVETYCPSRRTLTDTAPDTSQDTETSCPTSGLAGCTSRRTDGHSPCQARRATENTVMRRRVCTE